MAFNAKLKVSGKEFDIQNFSYSFRRDTDSKGKPSSAIYGGTVDFVLETVKEQVLLESMVNSPTKALACTITISNPDGEGTLKEITLTDAYVIAFSESISKFSGESMVYNITMSCREIKVGSATLTNEWPKS